MGSFVYAPRAEARISTASGIIDVSEDISSGNVTRIINGASSATLTITNQGRKYDGLFDTMDGIVVYLTRITRLLVFTGYLDIAPVTSVAAQSLTIAASCTLKRLIYFPWDPGTEAARALLYQNPIQGDLDLSKKVVDVLTQVAAWPRSKIHIGQIPGAWTQTVAKVADELSQEATNAQIAHEVGSAGYVSGVAASPGNFYAPPGLGPNTGTGQLPALSGKCSYYGGGPLLAPRFGALPRPYDTDDRGAHGGMALTGERYPNLADPWYIAMRFPYQVDQGRNVLPKVIVADPGAAVRWWANRLILVASPKTGRAVVCRATDWGPAAYADRVIDLSPYVAHSMGVVTDDTVNISFAPPGSQPGPVDLNPASSQVASILNATGVTTAGGNVARDLSQGAPSGFQWGDPVSNRSAYERSNISTITVAGMAFKVNSSFTENFSGFVQALIARGYHPKAIGGFAVRGIEHSAGLSNHAYGAAIDIDYTQNPIYFTAAGGPHIMPDWAGELAKEFGLWWGGYYHTRKDYMHFELIGAPATPAAARGIVAGHTAANTQAGATADSTTSAQPAALNPGGGTDPAQALFNIWQWQGQVDTASLTLTGIRSLANDVPVMTSTSNLLTAGMREFSSAPNGDFIAWFPDHFGHYGTAATFVARDIELRNDFQIAKQDGPLKTHWYVTGALAGPFSSPDTAADPASTVNLATTAGIASVEFAPMMEAIFGVSPLKDHTLSAQYILDRYGARPKWEQVPEISSPRACFYFALTRFAQNWAAQYTTRIPLTFMPEVWTGMQLQLPDRGIQGYVQEVSHSFSLGDGGGFQTDVTVIAPSRINSRGPKGLPLGGPRSKVG